MVCTKHKQLPSNKLHSLGTNASLVALSVTFQEVHKVSFHIEMHIELQY